MPLLRKLSCDLCVVVNEEEWYTTTMTDLKQRLIFPRHTNAFPCDESECDQVVGKYFCCLIQIVQKGLFVSVWPLDVRNDHQNNFVLHKILNPFQESYVLLWNTIDRPRCLSSAPIKNLMPVESNDGLWPFVCTRIKELEVTVETPCIGLPHKPGVLLQLNFLIWNVFPCDQNHLVWQNATPWL